MARRRSGADLGCMTHRIKFLTALAVATVAAAFAAPAARAGLLVSSAQGCTDPASARVFAPWLDPFRYVPVHDGGFEAEAAGWRLGAGAGLVDANEPWRVGAPGDSRALEIAGGTVTSPAMCVGVEHPTIRFFARNVGAPTGVLTVEALVRTSIGVPVALPVGVVAAPVGGWAPTLPYPVVVSALPLLPGARTLVSFRFTAAGPGSAWQVDDVYLDPYSKR
jgi:hypothetical protein